jgi:hypothetical protein
LGSRKKLILCILTTIALICIMGTNSYASTGITVNVDGQKVQFTQEPIIKDGRTLVPLRAIFEALGLSVEWDQNTQSVTASKDNVIIKLQIGNVIASVSNTNSEVITTALDVAPQIINSRTLVPVRFVGEAAGADVYWNQDTKTVDINSNSDRYFGEMYDTITDGMSVLHLGYMSKLTNFQDGFGMCVFGDGDVYTGNFVHGIIQGYGSYVHSDKTVYMGNFTKGLPEGSGTLMYSNGDTYIGNFTNGVIQGIGTYFYNENKNYYTGEFKNGLKNGNGTFTWNDGTTYLGEWYNDQRNGYGELIVANGETYVGHWVNDKMNGLGKYTFVDGSYYEGNFSLGNFVNGKIYNSNGTIIDIIEEVDELEENELEENKLEANDLNSDKYDNYEVKSVTIKPNSGEKIVLKVGENYLLEFEIYPSNSFLQGPIDIKVEDPDVLLVWNDIWTIHALNTGKTIITLTTSNGVSDTCIVEVID